MSPVKVMNSGFEEKIGYKFKNPALLEQALLHSSFANERPGLKSNERYEFLGDSILGMIAAEYFFSSNKTCPEGELTRLKSTAVCEKTLVKYAQSIDLGSYLQLGKGEINTNGARRASILADAFEAVIAAIYLDSGFMSAKKFVLPFLKSDLGKTEQIYDYKTILQEVIQQNPGGSFEYILLSSSGPDHDKIFEFAVKLNGKIISTGSGSSKKRAEQEAAKQALIYMEYKF